MRLLVAMMLAIPLCGQNFEVASIRHNLSGDERDAGINILPGGRISGTNLTLKTLIWQAYNTVDFRLTGGPGWLDKDRYDIAAKTTNSENIGLEQYNRCCSICWPIAFSLRRIGRPAKRRFTRSLSIRAARRCKKTRADRIGS
jgi:hypothetical protein